MQALCPRAAAGIASWAASVAQAQIDGLAAAPDAARAEAVRRLRAARRVVIGGLGGDVQAARAALALADHLGARVVHRNQFVAQRNLFAMQGRGGVTTTLAEVRHRAQMVVVAGGDVTAAFPRVLERIFTPEPVFTAAAQRRLVLLGAPVPRRLPAGVVHETVDLGGLDLFEAIAVLRAAVRLPALPAVQAPSVPPALRALAQAMRECPYGVLTWAAADLPAAGADILVEGMHQLLADLNRTTRWGALPLGGSEGDLSANAVATWQTGFALPVDFSAGHVAYDPFPDYSDADLLLWVNALPGVGAPQLPGAAAGLPVIVVGTGPGAQQAQQDSPCVFLPAAMPGITASGHLVRTDGVITLFAPQVRPSPLAPAAQVLDLLCTALGGSADRADRAIAGEAP